MSEPLNFSYDAMTDTLTIEGVRYAGGLFRSMGNDGVAVGSVLRIVRRADGVITLQSLNTYDELEHELAKASVDAERYRWLKEKSPMSLCAVAYQVRAACSFATPDEAVDAARAEK